MKLTEKSLAAAAIVVIALFLQTPDGLPIWGPVPAAAGTTVSDTIQSDTTRTREGSPYIVTGDVRVLGKDGGDGVTTLTIEAGVTIEFDRYQSLVIVTSDSEPGALAAMGEPDLPIRFTSNEATTASIKTAALRLPVGMCATMPSGSKPFPTLFQPASMSFERSSQAAIFSQRQGKRRRPDPLHHLFLQHLRHLPHLPCDALHPPEQLFREPKLWCVQ